MTTQLRFDKVTVDIAAVPGETICFIILPMHPKADDLRWREEMAARFRCTLAAIAGVSWDHDMTPWEAPDIGRSTRMLKGRGAEFLQKLRTLICPGVEAALPFAVEHRYLIGISLSGLFAIWASTRCSDFERIGSVSGSLWYDGFTQWLSSTQFYPAQRYYLSLGDLEKNTKDSRVAAVEDRTLETVEILRGKGTEVLFEMNPGTHFAPMHPRLEKALEALMK